MEKHHSCINSLAIIQYVEKEKPRESAELFSDLGPEMAGISNPRAFLSDPNNWISSSLMIRIFEKVKAILGDENAAYKIGFNSVLNQHLGYIQRIVVYAFGNPARGIKHIQRVNDHFNKTKRVEILNCSRNEAVIRLIWIEGIPLSRDYCLMNKGIYRAVPLIWGLPPGRLKETKCYFKGDDYCEYHLQWEMPNRAKYLYNRLFTPWKIVHDTITELEKDKDVLREKYNQIHKLNQDLRQKVDQITSLQESSTAILSTLKVEELLDLILTRLLDVGHLDRAGIFLVDENKENLVLIHAVGVGPDILSDLMGYRIPLTKLDNIIARTAKEKKAVFIEDVGKMSLNPRNPILQKLKPKAFILVPMTVKGKAVGIVVGDNNEDGSFVSEIDRDCLTSFANHIAIVLENANLYKKLEDSERKYREIVENVNEGIWILDESGTIKYCNYCLREMLHCGDLVGRSVYNFVDETGKKTLIQAIMANMEGRTAKKEIVLQCKSNEPLSVLLSSVPILTDDQYSGSLALVADLTEKKRIESRLLQTQKLEAVGTMASGIAHDFNNILTGILGYTALLKHKTNGKSDLARYIDVIERSGLRAADLVKKLLAFSRNRQPESSSVSAVNDIVRETMELLKNTLPKNIEAELSLQEDLPLVKCDPTQVQQTIMNICLNAQDAMPDGGRIIVTTSLTEYDKMKAGRPDLIASPGRYVCLSISDSGTGIEPEARDRIFDPFYTTKEVGKGSGLGLAMVYGILKSSGGYINVDSEVEQGTTFELFFPVTESGIEEADMPSEGKALGGSETILVVDDEEIVRDLATEVLSSHGYRVMPAKDGLEALHVYKAFGYDIDLVLMDMLMPRMGGKEAYKKLKEINPEVKVLFCSGHGSDCEVVEDLHNKGLPFVSKPYKINELAEKVRQMLDRESSGQEMTQ